MSKPTSSLLPATGRRLRELGERIRLARLRRKLAAAAVAERAGMTPVTLRRIERGEPSVTIGAYVAVLQTLGLESDIDRIAFDDVVGRQLQDSRLRGQAAPSVRSAKPRVAEASTVAKLPAATRASSKAAGSAKAPLTAANLARLIAPTRAPNRRL